MKYFSPSTKGFYYKDIHGDNIPSDSISISDDHHVYLTKNQSSNNYIDVEDGEVVFKERIPTQEELDNQYKIKRHSNYPRLEEQLDMLYWDRVNGTDNWFNKIKLVKEQYPKTK